MVCLTGKTDRRTQILTTKDSKESNYMAKKVAKEAEEIGTSRELYNFLYEAL
jgi:hypothetical protein